MSDEYAEWVQVLHLNRLTEKDLNKMSLRETMECTANIAINRGGLSIFFEKIVQEIERLEEKIASKKESNE